MENVIKIKAQLKKPANKPIYPNLGDSKIIFELFF